MTDLHSHILPGMDDGSRSVGESLTLLEMEKKQGVTAVALTPHFYRWREEAEAFLSRRGLSYEALTAELPEGMPSTFLGAEVAWFPTLAGYRPLERLCLGDSRYFLLELPFEPWPYRLLDQVYDLACVTGLTPILAHVERYLPLQSRERMDELLSMGLPMQMNTDSLLPSLRRGRHLRLLERGKWLLGSDCHSVDKRPPRWAEATRYLDRRLGPERAAGLTDWTPEMPFEGGE